MFLQLIRYIISIFYFLFRKKDIKTIISFEGNIGVGKTSMINLLKENLGDKAEYIYEPINEWQEIKDYHGKDILHTFYDDKYRWSYTFQNIAYITRMMHIVESIKNSEKKYIILDRSLSADLNTFAKMLYDDGYMNTIEWNAYNKWNKFFEDTFGYKVNHLIVYLRSEPDIAYQRMQSRNRLAEKDVPYEYLKKLHQYHDKWLMDKKDGVLVLDANKDYVKNKNRFNELYNEICKFVNTK